MKRVLVTGSNGFLGREVVLQLLDSGFHVIGISRTGSNFSRPHFEQFKIDLTHRHVLDTVPSFDVVIHLAGSVSAVESFANPLDFVQNNIIATANLLDLFRLRVGIGMIYASTAKIYPVIDQVSRTPYGTTKLCADLLAQEFQNCYKLPISILRFTSFYGPSSRLPSYPDQSWVNWFCYSNLIGESIALYGDGQQQRDPLHITDAANLIVQLVIAEQYSIFSDVGGGEKNRITPVEVVEAIQYITGKKFSKVERMELRSDMKKSFVANNSLVQSLWKPTKNITEGLVETLERMKRTL